MFSPKNTLDPLFMPRGTSGALQGDVSKDFRSLLIAFRQVSLAFEWDNLPGFQGRLNSISRDSGAFQGAFSG